jgi:predicted AAA+ superfamily ATPase
MPLTNQDRVGKGIELLRTGLAPFVERELTAIHKHKVMDAAMRYVNDDRQLARKLIPDWDAAGLLKLMWEAWNDVFRNTLGPAERSLLSELRDVRNKWAHQNAFSSDDTDRALDSMARLLTAVSAAEADEVNKMKQELRRTIYEQQVRDEKKKAGGSLIDVSNATNLKPWREIVTPHPDVASGRYQQAEFAADLWQVHLGEGSDEYRKPVEFFRRTYLTESLKRLLTNAVQRLSGEGGDPVVQLQTNFGGGKTHSMLALYHLFSGVHPSELPGVDAMMAEANIDRLKKAKRVVLVGNKISPGRPVHKPDGVTVRTLWGELAYQLGGKEAYQRLANDDELATSPGDLLRELFVEYGPCLILIDEWVAYARQLHDQSDLPAGSFETQFSFAQALTESAKLAKNCLLVVSLPASDTAVSPHAQADDVEVGGIRGREALDRLRNVIGRLESPWRPASAEEGFEIVRRRLFENLGTPEAYKQRDLTARAFSELYRNQAAEFPPECRTVDYEKRIQAAFPIHPEIFDRLYEDWSTLVKFQRTRGVLRLMAAVIHSLWENGDRTPLVLPSTIPIDDQRVQFELTRYLSDVWVPIIASDVDGPHSLPLRIDSDVPNLGKLNATRRVARTIYLGSAPKSTASQRGLEDRRVRLGCVLPGESPAIFGDAMRRLAANATYLYQDGPRAWYSTQPTVTKLAEDRAEQLRRDPDKVIAELEVRIRNDLKKNGDFEKIHPMPRTGADVPDDMETRLVVLPPECAYTKDEGNAAEVAAKTILETRGNAPRLYRNTLVFLAADKARFQDLDEAIRKFLAWQSILDDKIALNLGPHQERQANGQLESANATVNARLPESYQWLLAPEQKNPQSPISWRATRLSGNDPLAVRARKKLKSDESLITVLGSTILRKHLDEVPLWRGNHVAIRQLVEDFATYLYLPRLQGSETLLTAIQSGVSSLIWPQETFAYAESYDESTHKYLGLRAGCNITVSAESRSLIVRPAVARAQMDADREPDPETERDNGRDRDGEVGGVGGTDERDEHRIDKKDDESEVVTPTLSKRFYGTVSLDPTRVGRDAGKIGEEVVSLLTGLVGSEVRVTLEIEASIPSGASDHMVRAVTENCRVLKFTAHSFERE